jgi:hypothetical protein
MDTNRWLQGRLFLYQGGQVPDIMTFMSYYFCEGRAGCRISAYVYGKCCMFPGWQLKNFG